MSIQTDCVKEYPEFRDAVEKLVDKNNKLFKFPGDEQQLHASKVGRCLRQLVICYIKKISPDFDNDTMGNLDIGSSMEYAFKDKKLIRSHISYGRGRIRIGGRNGVSGETDDNIIDPVNKELAILEIKCPKYYGLKKALQDLGQGMIRRDYYYQLQTYMWNSNTKHGVLVYLGRDTLANWYPYKVTRDKKALQDIQFRTKGYYYCTRKKKYPEIESGDDCQWCPCTDECKALPTHFTLKQLKTKLLGKTKKGKKVRIL